MYKLNAQPEMNIIGGRIREARKAAHLKQRELSIQLELKGIYICRGSISRLEHGARCITDYEIKAIAEILAVSPNDLFGWNTPTHQGEE